MSSSDDGHADIGLTLGDTLTSLRALAEETRLRILALLVQGELSVSDLTDILGQSQPRISRHLKVLVEAGLVRRHREGAWAFFRLADLPGPQRLIGPVLAAVATDERQLAEDRERLAAVREQRSIAAQTYFARLAPRWDKLRSLHASEEAVDAAVLAALGSHPVRAALDLGTGTGRMLEVLAPRVRRLVGLDASHAMLSVARANLERSAPGRVELRQGDIYAPPFERDSFDLVIIHQVLHYLEEPARAITQAARLVTPGGRLLIVDFAPHALEFLREREAHRRLGFATDQVAAWLAEAGLSPPSTRLLAPPAGGADQLTVSLWLSGDARSSGASARAALTREVA